MCHVGCRYEYKSGYSCGECRLGDENPPRDAMCSVDDLSIAYDSLKAENAKLRKRLAQYELFECVVGDPSEEFARLRRELHRLQRENAKLRELVREISFPYKYGDFDCGLCPHTDKCWDSETLDFNPDGCVILQMVRELGFEVGE